MQMQNIPSYTVYNNMKITFDDKEQTYRIDDKLVARVTHATGSFPKDWLAPWAAKMACQYIEKQVKATEMGRFDFIVWLDEVLKEAKNAWRNTRDTAASKGTEAHRVISQFIKAEMNNESFTITTKDKDVTNAFDKFLMWYGDNKEKIVFMHSEMLVGSRTYEYAGTFDILMKYEGKLVLVDLKTGKGEKGKTKDDWNWQLSAYQRAWEDMSGDAIDYRAILWIPVIGDECEFIRIKTPYAEDFAMFCIGLNMWYALKRYDRIKKEMKKK